MPEFDAKCAQADAIAMRRVTIPPKSLGKMSATPNPPLFLQVMSPLVGPAAARGGVQFCFANRLMCNIMPTSVMCGGCSVASLVVGRLGWRY